MYLGAAILDLSKLVMYEFHYDYMKPNYGSKIVLDGFTFAHGSSPGLVCKQELIAKVWHPDRVKP